MEWINGLFTTHSALQTMVLLSLIIAAGLALGKLHVKGISLGVAFVFFVGIVAGHFQLSADKSMLDFAETFGLTVFVYTLGLYVGPNFFGLLRHEGIAANLWSLGVIVIGTVMALGLCLVLPVSLPDMVGILCGATTNTPALGAAQQALEAAGQPSGGAALGCAVTYPLGVVGVILAMILIRKLLVKPADLEPRISMEEDNTYVAQFVVINPALEGKTLSQISQKSHIKFPSIEILLGKKIETDWNKKKIDWNAIDAQVESRVIVLSRRVLNGKHLGQLHLRDTYGVNVSRIQRGDIKLLATDDIRLQYGDRVTVVGAPEDINHVEGFLGNAVQTLNEPNLAAIFLGIMLGLALGTIPLSLPGMSAPVRLGIAGGPIIMGILVGSLGSRAHFISYTTPSASLMLRKLGLSLYLACLGLEAGYQFFETVVRPEGLLWIGIGFALTVVPVLIIGAAALLTRKYDFGTICGILCGSMANPMALSYANDTLKGDSASISYTSVYPLGMFVRVVIAQVLVMFLV